MKMCKKGQGATEYLLMLAAVLVIVAIAVYYISTAGAGKPAVTMAAVFDTSDNSIDLQITSGSVPQSDWQFRIISSDGENYINSSGAETTDDSWISGTGDIDPTNSPLELVDLAAGHDTGNYTVQIYHVASGSRYSDMTVNVTQ